ncbi:MAG: hypothetical protein ACI3XQ_04355, partial [Eubacteriales bacterium]
MNSSEFLTELRAGRIRENTEYTVSGSVVFDTRDSGKHYDLKNAGLVIVPDSVAAIRFGTSENVTLENARITTDADIAVLLDGKDNALVGCDIRTPNNGIIDRGSTGSLMERNRITAGKVGIVSETADSIISRNTVDGGKCGIRAAFARSEISAAMSDGYNILVSENLVRGAELSLDFKNVSNGVVLLNSLENAAVCGCTNIYVAENRVSGVLKLQMNRYLLANANRTGSTVVNENSEINGDTVTDLRERADVGVNEKLLPHINRELFVGMRRKTAIRTATGFVGMYDYITSCHAEGKVAIIPPGAYTNGGMDFSETEGLTVYAYGVLDEINTRVCSVSAKRLKNFTLKGMFFANEVYPCSQGTVLEYTEDKTLKFRTDPGYRKNFADGRFFGGGAPVFHFLPGEASPECEFRYSSKTYDEQTDVNTLYNISGWWKISPGDRVALRTDFAEGAMYFVACDGVYLEDVTVFCCSGFAISDSGCEVAPLLHRYAVVEGPAPVLTEDEPIPEGAKSLIWRDSYGRLRSAPPMFTTCDATHCTNARRGIYMVSCLLENMNDDGGNINAHYGLAHSYDPATKTLTYTRCNDPHGYQLLPSAFRRGDRVMLYTMSGRLVA